MGEYPLEAGHYDKVSARINFRNSRDDWICLNIRFPIHNICTYSNMAGFSPAHCSINSGCTEIFAKDNFHFTPKNLKFDADNKSFA